MIPKRLALRLTDIARASIHLPDSNKWHFSFILKRNNIVSMGYNLGFTTHPLAKKYNHRFSCRHSEISAICSANVFPSEFKHCSMINIRVRPNGNIGLSKPCLYCQTMLWDFDFKSVFYSTNDGGFERL